MTAECANGKENSPFLNIRLKKRQKIFAKKNILVKFLLTKQE